MQELDDRHWAEYTQHPKIFMNSYWGSHRLGRRENIVAITDDFETVVQNRNNFVSHYFIVKYYDLPKIRGLKKIEENTYISFYSSGRDNRDHVEYYKCVDGRRLTIFSMHTNDEEHDHILSKGYTLIEPLYIRDQKTYLKFIDT